MWVVGSGGPKKELLDEGSDPHAKGKFVGKGTCRGIPDDTLHRAISCAKMAELIEMPFGLWTQVGPRKYVLPVGKWAPPGKYN